jgi:hypothetical protein
VTAATAEDLALALRERHPEVEPLEADLDAVVVWVHEAGGDGDDPALVAAVLVAWEALL